MTQLTEDQLTVLAFTASLYLRESSAITIAKQKLAHALRIEETVDKHVLSVVVQTVVEARDNTFIVVCLTCQARIVIQLAEVEAAIKAIDDLPELVLLRDALKVVFGGEMS